MYFMSCCTWPALRCQCTRAQWLLLHSVCDANSTKVTEMLRAVLARGNFTHVYNYADTPNKEPQGQQAATSQPQGAEAASPQQQQQQQQVVMPQQQLQQQAESAGVTTGVTNTQPAGQAGAKGVVAPTPTQGQQQPGQEGDARAGDAGVSGSGSGSGTNTTSTPDAAAKSRSNYPVDGMYIHITPLVRAGQHVLHFAPAHTNFIFTRKPLGTTLQIAMPAPVPADFWSPPAGPSSTNSSGNSNVSSTEVAPAEAPSPGDPPEVPVVATEK